MTNLSRAQNLVNSPEQAVAVVEHRLIELAALGIIHGPRLQRLQIQAYRSHRRLQLVRDGIDKCIMLRVPPDFAHQERRVQYDSRNNHQRHHNAEKQENSVAPPE